MGFATKFFENLYKISEKPCKSETGYVIIQTPSMRKSQKCFFREFFFCVVTAATKSGGMRIC